MTSIGLPSDPAVLKEERRLIPAVGSNQVLVKVHSAALNPIDYKLAEGRIAVIATPPFVLGFDFAGTVVKAGDNSGFKKGQEVFGDVPNRKEASLTGGSLSTYILVPANLIALKPANLSMEEASSISLVGQTVLDCFTKAAPSAGSRVLILGASGGVGTLATQIAKARGLHVIGVCSGKNEKLVKSLGADEVIDYKQEDWSSVLANQKVEVVFDFAPSGPSSVVSWDKSQKVLQKGGRFVTISGDDPKGAVTVGSFLSGTAKGIWRNTVGDYKYHMVLKKSDASKLKVLADMAQQGELKAVLDEVYPWDKVHTAFAKLMSGRAKGKIVVTVDHTESDSTGAGATKTSSQADETVVQPAAAVAEGEQ